MEATVTKGKFWRSEHERRLFVDLRKGSEQKGPLGEGGRDFTGEGQPISTWFRDVRRIYSFFQSGKKRGGLVAFEEVGNAK